MTSNSPVGISYMQYELKGIIESVNLNDEYFSGKFVAKFCVVYSPRIFT